MEEISIIHLPGPEATGLTNHGTCPTMGRLFSMTLLGAASQGCTGEWTGTFLRPTGQLAVGAARDGAWGSRQPCFVREGDLGFRGMWRQTFRQKNQCPSPRAWGHCTPLGSIWPLGEQGCPGGICGLWGGSGTSMQSVTQQPRREFQLKAGDGAGLRAQTSP